MKVCCALIVHAAEFFALSETDLSDKDDVNFMKGISILNRMKLYLVIMWFFWFMRLY